MSGLELNHHVQWLLFVFRLSSSGSCDGSNDAPTNHAESYFKRRENRLSARKKAEEESANNDYKKASCTVCTSVLIKLIVQHKLPSLNNGHAYQINLLDLSKYKRESHKCHEFLDCLPTVMLQYAC